MKRSGLLIAICLLAGMVLYPDRCRSTTRILKKAYKTYTLGSWQGQDIFCEPYQVKAGDWLLKIFKQKGNLSEMNFPLFLSIFKHLNPHISNPDHIRPGQQITIPLKKIKPRDFHSSTKGRVIVPILQMSEVSDKIDRLTRQSSTQQMETSPAHNSDFQSIDMENIRRYAAMKGGNVLSTGTYYFPGPGQKDIDLDLAATPMVQLKDNSKIIILPHGLANKNFLQSLQNFQQNISIMNMEMLEKELPDIPQNISQANTLPSNRQAALEMLLDKTGFEFRPYETSIRMEGGIKIPVNAQLVPLQPKQPDLLIFQGSIYGQALTLLTYQGYAIVSILPGDHVMAMAKKLFKAMGISTMENPVFMNPSSGQSISIPGLFIGDEKNVFLSPRPVGPALLHFFNRNKVEVLQINHQGNVSSQKTYGRLNH